MALQIALLVPAPLAAAGNGARFYRRLAAALRAAGHHIEVAELAGQFPVADAATKAGAQAAWQAVAAGARPVIDGLALPAFADLAEALADRAVALVHRPAALQRGLPEDSRAALRATERAILPRLAKVIATSPGVAERLHAEFAVPAERLAVIVPGVERAPRSAGSGGPGCAILSVGSLVPRRGHDVLLRALARLFDLDWSLTIAAPADAGDDPVCAQGLHALAEQLGIAQRVCFAGAVDEAALGRLWHTADLFALASSWEGYPVTIAEALAHGLPVAIAAEAAVTAMVPQEAGVICPAGDHEGLSKAMRRPVFDVDLRRYLADQAWESGQALPDWPAQARAFAAALE